MAVLAQRSEARALHTCITDGNSNLVIRPDMGRHIVAATYPPEMPIVDDPLADASPADHLAHAERITAAVVLGVDQVGTAPVLDAGPLRPSRFAETDLMHLSYGPSARA